jgi:hypothetical protein
VTAGVATTGLAAFVALGAFRDVEFSEDSNRIIYEDSLKSYDNTEQNKNESQEKATDGACPARKWLCASLSARVRRRSRPRERSLA